MALTPVSRYVSDVEALRRDVADYKRAVDLETSILHSLYTTHRERLERLEEAAGLTWNPREGSGR